MVVSLYLFTSIVPPLKHIHSDTDYKNTMRHQTEGTDIFSESDEL